MTLLIEIHALMRWAILLIAALAIVRYTLGWLRGLKYSGMDRGLSAAFSGLMDLQVLLGSIYFLITGFAANFFPAYRFEHLFVMLLAAVAAHLPAMWKKQDDRIRFRNGLLVVLLALLLVYLGVALLPDGWAR